MAKSGDANLEMSAPVVGAPVYCDGAAFNKDDTALRDAFDVELTKMKASGEFAAIITESILITETGVDCLANVPRKLFVKD